jgi:asparagine synthase (glutamine-hydrolysing)
MCGICGRINRENGDGAILRTQTEQMMRLMEHRGPDHGGMWGDALAAIGYRRLSVIDLATGNQPVRSEDGTKILVFNGEIYNFLELKEQFGSEVRFHTNSDTEVVMRLYEKFGPACLNHFRGMFAFAIWDSDQQTLFFARDRTGKKPFFYSVQNGNLIFASELRSLLVHDDFHFETNPDSIYHYLSLQYIPSPDTIFKNVSKLPPAHFGVFKKGNLQIERYWKLDYVPAPWKESEALERFHELLQQAVSLRLISDVPLGAFLSGGIDSTTIVSMMAAVAGQRVRTFNISFREQEFDEGPFAKEVAQRFGTEHQELTVTPDHAAVIPKLAWHYSEPYADPSAIPTYYLSCMTRGFVTVALSGDGGDELFGGYPRYLFTEPADGKASAESRFIQAVQKIPMNLRIAWRIRKWMEEKFLNLTEIYFQKISAFNELEKRSLLTPSFAERTRSISTIDWLSKRMQPFDRLNFPQNLMAFDTETYLPDDLLVKTDIASMACSLEVRCPLLDQEMLEFAARLPLSLKIRNGVTKYLLKRYLNGKIPEHLITRPKTGFGVPLKSWFRHELRSMTEDLLLSRASVQRGYFRKNRIEKIISRHGSGLFDHSYQLYTLVMLELWHTLFVDARKESLNRLTL